MTTTATMCIYAITILVWIRISHESCICPSWKYNVTHHEFCGKELSGESCVDNARYNCTKGIPKAVYWDCCKDSFYEADICTPKIKDDCKQKSEIKATLCMTQRTCSYKIGADRRMMAKYGKTSLLSKQNRSCDRISPFRLQTSVA
jgi:hypothetical protein